MNVRVRVTKDYIINETGITSGLFNFLVHAGLIRFREEDPNVYLHNSFVDEFDENVIDLVVYIMKLRDKGETLLNIIDAVERWYEGDE